MDSKRLRKLAGIGLNESYKQGDDDETLLQKLQTIGADKGYTVKLVKGVIQMTKQLTTVDNTTEMFAKLNITNDKINFTFYDNNSDELFSIKGKYDNFNELEKYIKDFEMRTRPYVRGEDTILTRTTRNGSDFKSKKIT